MLLSWPVKVKVFAAGGSLAEGCGWSGSPSTRPRGPEESRAQKSRGLWEARGVQEPGKEERGLSEPWGAGRARRSSRNKRPRATPCLFSKWYNQDNWWVHLFDTFLVISIISPPFWHLSNFHHPRYPPGSQSLNSCTTVSNTEPPSKVNYHHHHRHHHHWQHTNHEHDHYDYRNSNVTF